MIESAVLTILENATPKYIIIGYKPDRKRGIPPTFEFIHIFANTESEILEKTEKLTRFRVFELGKEFLSYDEWITKRGAVDLTNIETAEREQLQYLKQKYESK